MLGSEAEAQDAVQGRWIRAESLDVDVDNLDGWLTTVVARVPGRIALPPRPTRTRWTRSRTTGCRYCAAATRRVGRGSGRRSGCAGAARRRGGRRPAGGARRSPAERLAFVLHDMFGDAVRGDRADRGPQPRRREDAASRAQPGAAPARRTVRMARAPPAHRPRIERIGGPPARGGERVPGRIAVRRHRAADRRAGPAGRAASSWAALPDRAAPSAGRGRSPARRSRTAPAGLGWCWWASPSLVRCRVAQG